MTDVNFGEIVKAQKSGSDHAAAFCTRSNLNRLKGKIVIPYFCFENGSYMKACEKVVMQVEGELHLCLNEKHEQQDGTHFLETIFNLSNLKYASYTIKEDYYRVYGNYTHDKMVFGYAYNRNEIFQSSEIGSHSVWYRPALLNDRHIVDVLRAVCGPADVSDAELDRVRRQATNVAENWEWKDKEWKSVWLTWWVGAPITAKQ